MEHVGSEKKFDGVDFRAILWAMAAWCWPHNQGEMMIVTPTYTEKSDATMNSTKLHRDCNVPASIGAHIPDISAMQLVDDEPGWERVPWDEDLAPCIRTH